MFDPAPQVTAAPSTVLVSTRRVSLEAERLRQARALIEDPKRWCKLALRLSAPDGSFQYCALGAVLFGPGISQGQQSIPLLNRAAQQKGYAFAYLLNNAEDHAATLAMFDRAIALAESDAPVST